MKKEISKFLSGSIFSNGFTQSSSFRLILFLSYSLCFTSTNKGQNLVPNPGFEEGIVCPTQIGNVTTECNNWYASQFTLVDSGWTTSPEWFHVCSDIDNLSPPNIIFTGFQPPFQGGGYVGMLVYLLSGTYREHIGVQLSEPLQIGQQYLVEFSLIRHNGSPALAINNMGFRFTTYSHFEDLEHGTDNFSHFHIDTVVTSVSGEWTEASHVFTADSAYSYLHIGNFYDDQSTNVDTILPSGVGSYYLIDAVSVTEWKTTDAHTEVKKRIKIWPNPISGRVLHIEGLNDRIERVDLISSSGARIVTLPEFSQGEPTINIPEVTTGIYLIKIQTESQIYCEKVMITD